MGDNKELIKQCEERAQQWLTPAFDEETRKEVQAMLDAEDKSALIDAFYQNLEFGTGGLRGIMGAGTNRMNDIDHRPRCSENFQYKSRKW